MTPFDTTVDMAGVHEEAYRHLGMAGRLRIALELSDLVHKFAIAGIRRRNPHIGDDDVYRHLAQILYES